MTLAVAQFACYHVLVYLCTYREASKEGVRMNRMDIGHTTFYDNETEGCTNRMVHDCVTRDQEL